MSLNKLHASLIVLGLVLGACSPPPTPVSVGSRNAKPVNSDSDPDSEEPIGEGDGSGAGGTPMASKKLVEQVMAENHDCDGSPRLGQAQLRLLTPDEYQNTLKDVLGVSTDYRPSLFSPAEVSGFNNNADVSRVSDTRLGMFLTAAEKVAAEVRPRLSQLAGCAETAGASCQKTVISKLGPALWRRPLTSAEQSELQTFAARSTVASESMTLLLMRMLTSTNFLYRSEIGDAAGLEPYELASALSYFFWQTVPDTALLAAAADGSLKTKSVMTAQAKRLLADARAQSFLHSFASSWMGYKKLPSMEKDKALYPNFSSSIGTLMVAEANDTFAHIARKSNARFSDLYSGDYSIGGSQLAQFYKAKVTKEGSLDAISFEDEPRRGFHTLGAVFASHAPENRSNPFRIGGFLLSRLLCDDPEPTPAGVDVTLPDPEPGKTGRELAEQHSKNPACAGCHIKIDGLGFALENFDATGVYRTMDAGKPIDASGQLHGVDGKNPTFKGADGLSDILSKSPRAKRCFAIQLYRYAHGHLERKQDVCSIRDVAIKFENGDLPLADLIIQVITNGDFVKREQ